MAQILAIIVLDLTKVTYLIWTALIPIFFLFLAMFYLNNIDYSDCKQAYMLSLVSNIPVAFPLLIFMSIFGDLMLELRSLSFLRPRFLSPSFWFFDLRIFY